MEQPLGKRDAAIEASPYYDMPPYYGGSSDPHDAMGQGVGLLDLLVLIRRQWALILVITIVGTAIAAAYGSTRPDIYSAIAKLLIEPEHRVVDLDSVVESVGSDAVAIETQINLLKSRGFLERFATRSLLGVPISADLLSQMQALKGADASKSLVTSVSARQAEDTDVGKETKGPLVSNAVARILNGLSVGQEGRSFIINVQFSSKDAQEAADVANDLAKFYIEDQSDLRRQVTGQASRYLALRLTELESELLASEEAVQEYRSKNPQRLQTNIDTTSEQILDLTSLLVQTRAERKEKEARLRFIADLQSSGESLESLTEVLSSPYMATLWEEDAQLRSQAAEQRLELGANHPKIQTISAERDEVAQRIDRETDRIIENTKNELDVLIEREKSLHADLNEFTGVASDEAAHADKAQIQLRLLEGNADASRRIYEEFLLRLKQTREQEAIVQANTRLVANAQVPSIPSSRSPKTYILLGFIGASAAGVAVAFIREKTNRRIRTGKDLVHSLGVTYLGLTPCLGERQIGDAKIHEYLATRPASTYAETIRSAYTKSVMSNGEEPPKVYLITSSIPNEGKTTFALSLAILLGMDGKRVVLVDLDLRHPSVLKELGASDCKLVDKYLAGEKEFDGDFLNKHKDGFHFVVAKKAMENPGRAIRSRRLAKMIDVLKTSFDHVIIDSAPSLGLSDTKALSNYADACLFIVKWNETPFATVSDTLEELRTCRCPISGVILTQVDLKKQSRYGYGGIDDYYSENDGYYKN